MIKINHIVLFVHKVCPPVVQGFIVWIIMLALALEAEITVS